MPKTNHKRSKISPLVPVGSRSKSPAIRDARKEKPPKKVKKRNKHRKGKKNKSKSRESSVSSDSSEERNSPKTIHRSRSRSVAGDNARRRKVGSPKRKTRKARSHSSSEGSEVGRGRGKVGKDNRKQRRDKTRSSRERNRFRVRSSSLSPVRPRVEHHTRKRSKSLENEKLRLEIERLKKEITTISRRQVDLGRPVVTEAILKTVPMFNGDNAQPVDAWLESIVC